MNFHDDRDLMKLTCITSVSSQKKTRGAPIVCPKREQLASNAWCSLSARVAPEVGMNASGVLDKIQDSCV